MTAPIPFPRLAARDLEGSAVPLPEGFSGAFNLVAVAFRREQQTMVDSWVAWHERFAADHPGFGCYEVPVLATRWSPGRPVIDGGMAAAVRDSQARRRTLTAYTDVRRVTDALGIDDTATITVLLLDAAGRVRWRTTGPATEEAGRDVLDALTEAQATEPGAAPPEIEQFEFDFEARLRPFLALIGVTPGTAHATVGPDHLVARFGPWSCATPISNIREVCVTGPYRAYRAIGPRGSVADRGLTFGTTTHGGVCILVRRPVTGLLPGGLVRHPGVTLTVSDREGFAATLRRRAGLQ